MFGEVYLAINEKNSKLLAGKAINMSKQNDKTLKYLKNEKQIMEKLNHQNIIKLEKFFETKNNYFFIMEYCNGGTLSDLLLKYKEKYRKSFTLEIIQHFMSQIVEGLKYIHSKNIIHRDLKLDNILVHFKNISRKIKNEKIDFNGLDDNDLLNSSIKIIDFGLSIKLEPGKLALSAVGTPFNMDPLILKKYQKAGGYK